MRIIFYNMSGSPAIRKKALNGHYSRYLQSGGEKEGDNVVIYKHREDFWYAMIRNLGDPYSGAEFICTLEAGKNYPFGPPVVKFLTPNGTVKLAEAFCVDMGHYHSNNYPATLGMDGFARQMTLMLVLGMKGLGGGINLLNHSNEDKKKFSFESIEYNQKHNKVWVDMLMRVDAFVKDYGQAITSKNEERAKELKKIIKVHQMTSVEEMLKVYDEYLETHPIGSVVQEEQPEIQEEEKPKKSKKDKKEKKEKKSKKKDKI